MSHGKNVVKDEICTEFSPMMIVANTKMRTQFKISAMQKRRSRRTLVGGRNERGYVHGP